MRPFIYRYLMTLVVSLVVSVLGKLLFIALNAALYAGVGAGDILAVLAHGLTMDLTVSAYIAVLPVTLSLVSLWTGSGGLPDRLLRCYFGVLGAAVALSVLLDAVLYGYWHFKLDVTPFSYFASSPSVALASVAWWQLLSGVVAWAALSAGIWFAYYYGVIRLCGPVVPAGARRARLWQTGAGVLMLALLFIPIRGGVTVSTMNPSRAYFSTDQRLNHAAVNPVFSLLYSAGHQSRFGDQYRYFDDTEAARLFSRVADPVLRGVTPRRPAVPLLRVRRPNIHIIILESFSSHLFPSLGGEPVALGLDSIASRGLLWDNFYASSFRTDRGIPAILSGYPGQPGTSIMKYVSKTDNLPSLARTLVNAAGYKAEYFYGGDINFCNQQAYLVSTGFGEIISDKDFALGERLSKWGAHDEVVLSRAINDRHPYDPTRPILRVIQTSSSHEPFEVPYTNPSLADRRAVAFAYTDSCVTAYINSMARSRAWDNTLIVIVPDHYGAWPELVGPVARHQVPLIMTGGALNRRGREHTVGSQVDIAPTLLAALDLPHDDFRFGVDLLDEAAPHRAYFADPTYIGFITDDNTLVYNLETDTPDIDTGRAPGRNIPYAKAYLQTLYDDLDAR